ncbi:MAG: accessory gene regulator B family protein [Ruminococcus sp.]|nr:accessory gene regulator B family protein [Ruminococcus sp.]
MICKKVIEDDSREIYQYGFEQFFTTLLNIATILLLGVIFGKIYQILVFAAAFMAIRTYSGGYHAKAPIRCYIFTTISIAATLSVMKFVVINRFICLGLLILSSLVIILFSPIGTENKPLDEIEKIIYRKKTVIVWCIEVCAALVFIVLNITEIHTAIVLAQILISIALIFGKVQNKNL